MSLPLRLPLEPYDTGDYHAFGAVIRRRLVLWAVHLGDDVVASVGTPILAVGRGEVVWSEVRHGSEYRKNWGGIVVIRHRNPNQTPTLRSDVFYSVYGHLKNLRVQQGQVVEGGDVVGEVAAGHTPENGYWKHPHLHFSIYTGPWKDVVLPGWWRVEQFWRTRLAWWHDPRRFIEQQSQTP